MHKSKALKWQNKRTLTLVECQILISKTLTCKSKQYLNSFVAKQRKYGVQLKDILLNEKNLSQEDHKGGRGGFIFKTNFTED